MIAALTPWPVRSERKAAVKAATAEKQQSQAGRSQARDIEAQIGRLVAQNNWASAVAESLGIVNGDKNGGRK